MNKGWFKEGWYFKNEDSSNKLKMGGGSWTINLEIVDLSKIQGICYTVVDNGKVKTYKISSASALEKGFVRNFQGEDKLVVPLIHWEVEEAK